MILSTIIHTIHSLIITTQAFFTTKVSIAICKIAIERPTEPKNWDLSVSLKVLICWECSEDGNLELKDFHSE